MNEWFLWVLLLLLAVRSLERYADRSEIPPEIPHATSFRPPVGLRKQ